MTAETVAFLGLGATVLANIAALAWGASRISTTVERLDKTLDEVVKVIANESRVNATQDARLDAHEHRITRLEEA